MQVANKELLHIHRQNYYQGQWKPGNILENSKTEFNHYYKGLLTEPNRKSFSEFATIRPNRIFKQ